MARRRSPRTRAPLPPVSLVEHRAAIDACFGEDSIPRILARLEADGSAWAAETRKTLRAVSPSALFWSLEAIRRGAASTLPQALARELALTRSITQHPDFQEGVRAMVVDKDRQPKWRPSCIEDVDPVAIDRLFAD